MAAGDNVTELMQTQLAAAETEYHTVIQTIEEKTNE